MKRLRQIALLAVWVTLGAALAGCGDDPLLRKADTLPVDDVLRLIYEHVLQFDAVNGYAIAERALQRPNLTEDERDRLTFAKAFTLINYQPKSDDNVIAGQAVLVELAENVPALAPKAMFQVARAYEIHLRTPQMAKARELYRQILADYPDSTVAAEATWRLGANLIWRSDKRMQLEGQKVLEDFIAKHPNHELASSMHLVLGDAAVTREKFRYAVDQYIAAYEKGIAPHKRRLRAVYQIANIAYQRLDDIELAEKYYTIAVEKYWNWGGAFEAKEALKEIREKRGKAGGGARPAS